MFSRLFLIALTVLLLAYHASALPPTRMKRTDDIELSNADRLQRRGLPIKLPHGDTTLLDLMVCEIPYGFKV